MFLKIFILFSLFTFQVRAMDSFAPIVKKVMPTVVNISTEMLEKEDAPNVENNLIFENDGHVSLGSGFIADQEGYILTNRHVIEKAKEIKVKTYDGKLYHASIRGEDTLSDVALIKIEPQDNLTAAVFADSNQTEVGDFIIAIGNPFGLANSVTTGVVSALSRDIKETPFDDYIQTDAMINPGNSGGPMFNLKGEVVGLNTLIFSKQSNSLGVGFAIPSNQLKPIYEALKEKGKVERATIGVELKETHYENKPALIVSTIQNSELSLKNDLEAGDIILQLNGKDIVSKKVFETDVLWHKPQSTIVLNIVRNGEITEKTVELSLLTENIPQKDETTLPKITAGIYYPEIGLRVNENKIIEVDKSSEAFSKGIAVGDEIIGVDGHSFSSTSDLKFYIQESSDKHKFLRFDLKGSDGVPYFTELQPYAEKE